jgi:hypothetical protein
VRDWPFAVKKDFIKLYAIAKRNSKVTAKQFRRFCREIGAQIEPAHPSQRSLFETRLIEEVFAVEEYAFDATKLARWADLELAESGVQVRLSTRAVSIFRADQQRLSILLRDEDGIENTVHSRLVFNCTYSGLNQIGGDFPCTRTGIKQEITEMALMRPPLELEGLGITVMDGPFFSFMPFPAQGLHTLSHVRYTPHCSWADAPDINPYQKLANYNSRTRVDRMLRDVSRYLPSIRGASYVESLFEIKTILAKNEGDDGRPILFEKCIELPGCYSLLGGKIDNIYDVLEKLDAENLTTALEK